MTDKTEQQETHTMAAKKKVSKPAPAKSAKAAASKPVKKTTGKPAAVTDKPAKVNKGGAPLGNSNNPRGPKSAGLTLRVPEALKAQLQEMATQDDRTVNILCNLILEEYAKKRGSSRKAA